MIEWEIKRGKPLYKFKKHYRLSHFDYSRPGYYFITICVKDRRELLGKVMNGQMDMSEIGKIAKKFWMEIPDRFSNIRLDQWVIMPNHMHGILVIDAGNEGMNAGDNGRTAPRRGRTGTGTGTDMNTGTDMDMGTDMGTDMDMDMNMNMDMNMGTDMNAGELGSEFGSGLRPLDKNSISSVINHFKGNVKRYCNKNGMGYFQWQSRFHDRIIRDERALETIRRYIWENPKRWGKDRLRRNKMRQVGTIWR